MAKTKTKKEVKEKPIEVTLWDVANKLRNGVDDALYQPEDNPSIGLLLVKNKNKLVVEYALKVR